MTRFVLSSTFLGLVLAASASPGQSLQASGLATAAARPAVAGTAAQTSGALSLERCLELARANSNRRKAAASSVAIASEQHGQARSARYPAVNASLAATRLDENPNFLFPASAMSVPASALAVPPMAVMLPANAFGPGFPPVDLPLAVPGSTIGIPAQTMAIPAQTVELMDRNLLSATLKVFYPIYTGGLVESRLAQTRAGVEAARQAQRRTDLELAYDVTRAYWGVVLARQLVGVGRETLARMEATLEITESVFTHGAGRVRKTDYLRNKAMVETIRSMVAELDNQERVARAGLEAAVEWNADAPLEVADARLPFQPAQCANESAVGQALTSSPEVARLQAGLAAARAGVGVARSGRLPKVGLFANAQGLGNSLESGLVTRENRLAWSAGVGVELPLFDGFRSAREVGEARATVQKLQQQDALLRQAIGYEVKAACSAMARSAAQYQSSRDAYQAATENRELNVRAYQDELVDTKEVIEAQLMEALLAAQHYRVLYDSLDARARLDLVSGRPAGAR